jgi:signal transduction histidine kinase
MTLVGRTSAFFLGVLGLALAAFTLALYLMARAHLHHELNQRLEAAVDTLTASVGVERTVLEWEPAERDIILGVDPAPGQVRWAVCDAQGQAIAWSWNLHDETGEFRDASILEKLCQSGQEVTVSDDAQTTTAIAGETWRLLSRRLEAERPKPQEVAPQDGEPAKKGETSGVSTTATRRRTLFPALVVTSGASLRPVEQMLQTLLVTSVGLSAAMWIGAALLGGWLCRRALRPLTNMAVAARTMPATDSAQRLPLPRTGDELHDLAVAFNDLLGRVQDALARQRRFTSEASHQLRTPLTALLGQVDVALRQDRSRDEYQQTLVRVQRQGQRLVQIVEMLLFLARADADAELPDLEVIELGTWLCEHVSRWSSHERAADLHVETPSSDFARWESPVAGVLVRVHPMLLGQLLDNLLENACKYSDTGTPITLRVAAREGTAVLEVEDRGLGMAEADTPHLFEPFFRSSAVRRLGVEGIGLGLAVAKRIATAMGGNIEVHSRLGSGSLFRVAFPICDPKRGAAANRSTEKQIEVDIEPLRDPAHLTVEQDARSPIQVNMSQA